MFLSGFEDELLKLAEDSFPAKPEEIAPRQPTGPGQYDWAGYNKAWKAKTDRIKFQREHEKKFGKGPGLMPPAKWTNPLKTVDKAPEPKKKGRGRKKPPQPKSTTPTRPKSIEGTGDTVTFGSKLDEMIGKMKPSAPQRLNSSVGMQAGKESPPIQGPPTLRRIRTMSAPTTQTD